MSIKSRLGIAIIYLTIMFCVNLFFSYPLFLGLAEKNCLFTSFYFVFNFLAIFGIGYIIKLLRELDTKICKAEEETFTELN